MQNLSKPSILLVEDEENLHEALKMNLELEGYQVTSAFDGVKAMKAVQNEYFDLIIMDVMIPEIDGFGVTQNIRLTNTEVPILILSAKSSGEDRVLVLKKGADDSLTVEADFGVTVLAFPGGREHRGAAVMGALASLSAPTLPHMPG